MSIRHKVLWIGFYAMLFLINSGIVNAQYYENSYAVVIGIDDYPSHPTLQKLNYAVKDAESLAQILKNEGFKVIGLYDDQASKANILDQLLNLAQNLKAQDSVMVFFAGHGYTETFNDEKFGYIIPYDGTEKAQHIFQWKSFKPFLKRWAKRNINCSL